MVRRLEFRWMEGKRRKVGKGRFGCGSSSARRMNLDRLVELVHGVSEKDQAPSNATWDRIEVTKCPLLRVTFLQLVFGLKIRRKNRVFEVFKSGVFFFFLKICVFCWLRDKERWKI